MLKIYTIVDHEGEQIVCRTPIDEFLGPSEGSAIVNPCGLGLGAYVPRGPWDKKKVRAIYNRHGVKMIPHPSVFDPCQLEVELEAGSKRKPDLVMREFLDDFVASIIPDAGVEFRIHGGFVYGVRAGKVSENVLANPTPSLGKKAGTGGTECTMLH